MNVADESNEVKSDEEEAGARNKTHRISNAREKEKIKELLDPSMPAAIQKKEITLNISPDKDHKDKDRKD